MKKMRAGFFVIVSCAMLVASGCAKHEMVKADEPIASPATTAALPQVKAEPVKAQPVMESKVKQSPINESATQMSSTNADLQAGLERVYFNFDSYTLSGPARTILVKDADLLKKDTAAKVRIEGNCDERGSDEYNMALGERRAKAAQQYLVTLGIPVNSLSVISYGKEKPVDPGHDEAAWAKNRRDDIVVVTK